MSEPIDDIMHAIRQGQRFPYDASDKWQNSDAGDMEPPDAPEPNDWAHLAARGIIADLTDRRGIKNGFGNIDEETRREIVATMAKIIRTCGSENLWDTPPSSTR